MNMCGHKNNGWAEDTSYKYAGGLGMGAMDNTNTGSGGISGSSLGDQYNVTNPFVPTPKLTPVCPDLSPNYTGGIDVADVADVTSPACKEMAQTNAQWDALRASVDNILYGSTTKCAVPVATSAQQNGVNVNKSTNTLLYLSAGGAAILIITLVVLMNRKKGSAKVTTA